MNVGRHKIGGPATIWSQPKGGGSITPPQSAEDKQAALAKAQAKRERKARREVKQ